FANAFVTKLDTQGSMLIYSTYLGGGLLDSGYDIAVGVGGSAYVTGYTQSANFPTTQGAFQSTFGGGGYDAFVTVLNSPVASLVYSTYLGGNQPDYGFGLAVDSMGCAYVTGMTNSIDFPTTTQAFQTTLLGAANAFVTKLSPQGSSLAYSTYLGGSSIDRGD